MELTLTAATCVSLVLGVRVEQHIGGNMLYWYSYIGRGITFDFLTASLRYCLS